MGSLICEYHRRRVEAPASFVYREFASLGGERGWPSMSWAWRVRGALDRMVGGPGMRVGRPAFEDLRVGDSVDFWRVERLEPDHILRLVAEMKLPGRGWLEFRVEADGDERSVLEQTALFEPAGLAGRIYWYSLFLFHSWIFRRMIMKIAVRAEASRVPRPGA